MPCLNVQSCACDVTTNQNPSFRGDVDKAWHLKSEGTLDNQLKQTKTKNGCMKPLHCTRFALGYNTVTTLVT